MRENIEVVLERGDRLEDLEAKSAQLQDNALIFHKSAKKLKCKLCKQNARMTIICVIVAIVAIGVIAGIIALVVALTTS
jgi:Synaptobrevin